MISKLSRIKDINLKELFFTKDQRSINANKNSVISFILKMTNVGMQFVLVPVLLDFLDPLKYGIWITITSIINWFFLFDVGLGNGIKNNITKALAIDDKGTVRTLVSTGYVTFSFLITIAYLFFFIAHHFLNWQKILNLPAYDAEVEIYILLTFSFFSINFILKFIATILSADQKSFYNDLIATMAQSLSLLIVLIVKQYYSGSLIIVSLIFDISTILTFIFFTFYFFKKVYPEYKPSLKFIDFKIIKKITSLSGRFFIMQLAGIVLFSTGSILISVLYNPSLVTPYNIAHKYYSIIPLICTIIYTPLWAAYTEAYEKNEITWIKNKIKSLIILWFVISILAVVMVLVSGFIYKHWVGEEIKITFMLNIFMAILMIIISWNNIYAFFLNGVGKIRFSLYQSLFVGIINIPLSIFLAKTMQLGIEGIVLSTGLCLLLGSILTPIQTYLILNNKATGIWNE